MYQVTPSKRESAFMKLMATNQTGGLRQDFGFER